MNYRHLIATCLLSFCFANGVLASVESEPAPSDAAVAAIPTKPTKPTKTASTAVATPVDAGQGIWLRRGAGCLGGAVLGSVLPGLGNLIGCAVGAAAMSVKDIFGGPDKAVAPSVPALTKEE